jgi:hypothetical protein
MIASSSLVIASDFSRLFGDRSSIKYANSLAFSRRAVYLGRLSFIRCMILEVVLDRRIGLVDNMFFVHLKSSSWISNSRITDYQIMRLNLPEDILPHVLQLRLLQLLLQRIVSSKSTVLHFRDFSAAVRFGHPDHLL